MSTDSKIREIVGQVIENTDFKLVEINFKNAHARRMVSVFLDSETGITIDQCKDFSRIIGERLDKENVIENEYVLEVSSPGVDRPIREDWQFRKNIGREVILEVKSGDQARKELKGKIEGVSGDVLQLKVKGKKRDPEQTLEILLEDIQSARIQLKW